MDGPLDFESEDPLLINQKRDKVITLDDLLTDYYKDQNKVIERESKRAKTHKNYNSDDDDDAKETLASGKINELQEQLLEKPVPFPKLGLQTMDEKIEEQDKVIERESKRAKTHKNYNSDDDDDDNAKELLVSRKINECHEQLFEKQVVFPKLGVKIEEQGSERDRKLDQMLEIVTETRDTIRAQEQRINLIDQEHKAMEKSLTDEIRKFFSGVTNSSIWNTKALQVILCEFQRQGFFTPEGNQDVQAMHENLMKSSHEMWKINNALLSRPSPPVKFGSFIHFDSGKMGKKISDEQEKDKAAAQEQIVTIEGPT